MSHTLLAASFILSVTLACSRATPRIAPTAEGAGAAAAEHVKALIAALDTLQGEFRDVGDMVVIFDSNTRLLEGIAAYNEAAVPQLVECLGDTTLARATAERVGRIRVGVLCYEALVYTDYFQARNSVQSWPEGFTDSTFVDFNADSAELRRARRAWQRYLNREAARS